VLFYTLRNTIYNYVRVYAVKMPEKGVMKNGVKAEIGEGEKTVGGVKARHMPK
jgi:hypothetical protein